MRKAIIFGILLILVNSCSNHKEANRISNSGQEGKTSENKINNPNPGTTGKIFDIKSGYVKYKNQVAGIDMIREWWFDDFGAFQYEENYIPAAGKKTGGAAMVRDGYRYEWNINSSEGKKDEFHSSFINYEDAPKEVVDRFKIKKQGYETVAGKKCIKVTIKKPSETTTWTWAGIPLKTVTQFGGKDAIMEAIEVKEEENPSVKFKLPDGVSFSEN